MKKLFFNECKWFFSLSDSDDQEGPTSFVVKETKVQQNYFAEKKEKQRLNKAVKSKRQKRNRDMIREFEEGNIITYFCHSKKF